MAKAPFKLRSGNASAFKNLGSSPAKQANAPYFDISKAPVHPDGGVHPSYNPSKTTKAPKNFNTTGSKASTTPTWDPTKRQDVTKYVKGTKAYKAANPSTLSKVSKVGKKVLKKGLKFLGGKALGVAGMLSATSATATQPGAGTHGGKKQTTYNPKTGKYE